MQDEVLGLMPQAQNLMLPNGGYVKQYVFLFLANKILLQFVKDET